MTRRLFKRSCATLSLAIVPTLIAGISANAAMTGRTQVAGRLGLAAARGSNPRVICVARNDKNDPLLRTAQEENRRLTARERRLAWLMITQSDNNAATALWNEEGPTRMQHLLNLAKMTQTRLAYAWGLSLLTAHDEILLLTLLSSPNKILDVYSRVYAQYLMSHVISSQRWGVPAGAPTSVKVGVKNGWLPYPVSDNWEINSIGFFKITKPFRDYEIAMLTYNNPTMQYGIDTIEGAAEAIHHDLNPGAASVIPASVPNPSWGIPDEPIPARHGS